MHYYGQLWYYFRNNKRLMYNVKSFFFSPNDIFLIGYMHVAKVYTTDGNVIVWIYLFLLSLLFEFFECNFKCLSHRLDHLLSLRKN